MENISNITVRSYHPSTRKQTQADEKIRSTVFVHTWKVDNFRQRLERSSSIRPINSPTFINKFNEHTLNCQSKLYTDIHNGLLIVESEVDRVRNTKIDIQCFFRKDDDVKIRMSFVSRHDSQRFRHVAQLSTVMNKANGLIRNDVLTIVLKVTVTSCTGIQDYKSVKDFRLSDDLRSLLQSGSYSDVSLVVDGRNIQVHKAILACRSSVFAAMFQEDCSDTLEIQNYTFGVVYEVVRFCYTGSVEKVNSALLRASDEFDIAGLKIFCEDVLYRNLRVDNAVPMLIEAVRSHAITLRNKIILFIAEHLKEVINTPKFGFLSQSLLMDILKAWAEK